MPHDINPAPDPAQHDAQPGSATPDNPPVGALAGSGSIPRAGERFGDNAKISGGKNAAATQINADTKCMLRAKTVCELLGISRKTLWRWRRAGWFPCGVRLGPRGRFWDRDVVEAWVAHPGGVVPRALQEAR